MEDRAVYSLEDKERSAAESSGNYFGDMISLRVPASFLEEWDPSSETFLRGSCGEENSGESKNLAFVRKGTNQGGLILHAEPMTQVDIFELGVTSSSSEKKLVRIGNSSTRHTLLPSAEVRVKELGRKARERLEEELANKKEIVRLNTENNNIGPISRNKPKTFLNAPLRTAKKAVRKRKRPTTTKNYKQTISNIDNWIPDTKHFTIGKEERSNYVRLHGLPLHAHPEHIKKFFSGLNPDRILVLPSHSSVIPQWDAIAPCEAPMIERHPSHFRLFVKFKSSLIAGTAIERSGEAIEGAAVALTMTTKSDANTLLRNMAVDVPPGMSIGAFLTELETHLPTIVPSVLWNTASKHLGIRTKVNQPGDLTRGEFEYECNHNPSNISGYTLLANRHNTLIEQYEKLKLSAVSLCAQESSKFQQAIGFLVSAALNFLSRDIERLDQSLSRGLQTIGIHKPVADAP